MNVLLLCYHYTESYTDLIGTFVVYTTDGIETITLHTKDVVDYTVGKLYNSSHGLVYSGDGNREFENFKLDTKSVSLYNRRYKYYVAYICPRLSFHDIIAI